jgi:hypothetical protein
MVEPVINSGREFSDCEDLDLDLDTDLDGYAWLLRIRMDGRETMGADPEE